METRQLGRIKLIVSRIGLGLAALGRPGYINLGHADDLQRDYDVAAMQERASGVLDAAWAAGVRYFDTARSYGRGEDFLGAWLAARGIRPDEVTVGSKWGYTYTAGWRVDAEHHEIKQHSPETLERQIDESRERLGAQLDLYQIHSATLDSGVLENRAVLERLARLRDEGMAIGLSLSGPQQSDALRRALEVRVGGARVFDTVQATWNLLERSAGAALQDAHAAGLGVIVKEALANGRLTRRNQSPEFAAQRTRLAQVAGRLGCTIDALALAAVLARPWVDVVLSGAARVDDLLSNLGALAVRWHAGVDDALSAVAEEPSAYWATRSRMPWN